MMNAQEIAAALEIINDENEERGLLLNNHEIPDDEDFVVKSIYVNNLFAVDKNSVTMEFTVEGLDETNKIVEYERFRCVLDPIYNTSQFVSAVQSLLTKTDGKLTARYVAFNEWCFTFTPNELKEIVVEKVDEATQTP